ncbi:MFS transporter [Paraburkholderia sp. Ac-20340]|uniref:MFS transporter n=1 Tax=Paraburkholderia sp. Ac-20340 TaxID=2703888 RepID=UPI00197F8C95|nr:MFS transporter [Paraburkholderia sp. Ac-20340]MBN3856717.1 MFS transporter [Paraburkholderia sp. Ac-20340]
MIEVTSTGEADLPTQQRKDAAITASIFGLGALLNASLLCAPAIASQLSAELHFSPQYVGYFFSIEFLGYALAGILSTYAVAKFKWRKIAVIGLAIFIAGNFASPYFGSKVDQLFIIRAVTATAGCLINVICLAAAGRTRDPSRTYAVFVIGQLLFGVFGLAVLPIVFQHGGIANYYRIVAGLSIFALMFAVPFLPDSAGQRGSEEHKTKGTHSQLLASCLAFLWGLLFYASLSGVWTFVGAIGQTLGLDAAQAARFLSIATVAGIVGSGSAAVIGGQRSKRLLINSGFACMLLSVLAFMLHGSQAVFFVATLGFKFAWTFVLPFVFSAISDSDRAGRLFALVCVSIGVGLAIGPGVAGYLVTVSGNFNIMLAASATCCFAAWASISLLSKSDSLTELGPGASVTNTR